MAKSEDEPSRDVTPKENETTIVDDDKPLTPLLDDVGVINNQEKKGVTFAETNLVLERMINDRSEDADIESEGGNLPQDKQDTAVVVVGDDDISFASDFGEADIESVPVCSNLSELTYSTDTTKLPKNSVVERVQKCVSTVWGYVTDPYEAYVDLMYHIFDLSFGWLMVYFTVFYYLLCVLFALLIYAVGLIEPECVLFDGYALDDVTDWFDAVYTLSWTTFSTTGYGNTAPSLSEVDGEIIDGVEKCLAINTLLMLVSFVGIIYAGAAGAILYSKVDKIKGEGQVSFSQPCVIRFGTGLIRVRVEDEDKEGDKPDNDLCPCPVLEFRILNHNHHTSKGVIANSELRCLASVEDERDEKSIIGEDSRVNLPRRLFLNMELTNGEHPFFRRCWTATHVINEKSPLIKKRMRERIQKNHGFWPKKYSNADVIKRNLKFKQIIVNFTGVSKRTTKEVQAQQVYDIRDVIVGYQFINVLEKDNGNVVVKRELINDITEQNGDDKGEDLSKIIE